MAEAEQDFMGKFFDFGSMSLLGTDIISPETLTTSCETHPAGACLCPTFINDFGLAQEEQPVTNIDPESYANFAAWISRYSKPAEGCQNCQAKKLECYITFEGQKTCSPCNALFRECSFGTKEARPRAVMDTLHVVDEDQTMEQGAMTGVVALKSFDRSALETRDDVDDRISRKSGSSRFPRAAVKVLKDWMNEHRDHPYPTEEEQHELKAVTGLKGVQISNWLANTRRRTKTRSRVSPSMRSPTWPTSTSQPVDIPFNKKNVRHNGKTWDELNPLERWQHSPPENEPASVTAIVQAVSTTTVASEESSLNSTTDAHHRGNQSSIGSGSYPFHRAPSASSLETGQSDSLLSSGSFSNLSLGSSISHGSHNSFGSLGSRRKDHRRRRRNAANPSRSQYTTELRPFQCTFCTDRFKTKYDWTRHEKSLHLSLEKWMCAPIGPIVTTSSSGQSECLYCGEADPSGGHIETHNHRACEEKGLDARTFYRKDHLRQHLRLVHGCKMSEAMESWRSEASYIKSRCGFCRREFDKWQDRNDHLAKHFRSGAQMKDWKGCRGLDPAVAANVMNAMPPYLIGNEAKSPVPFSASNEATWHQSSRSTITSTGLGAVLQTSPTQALGPATAFLGAEYVSELVSQTSCEPDMNAQLRNTLDHSLAHDSNRSSPGAITCWEVLTVNLGRFVQDQIQLGILPSDEQLQQQARQMLYGEDDSWNQTPADNQEWLELFKKAHDLPSTSTDTRVDLDEDLGVHLGKINFEAIMYDESWGFIGGNDQMSLI